jgi:purine nucleoside permease
LIAGKPGASPEKASLGSAVWARWVVDGDLGYEIDAREMPPDWPTGYVPLRKTKPFETPAAPLDGQMYALNAPLADWAFALTKDTSLPDSDRLQEVRKRFDGAAAQRAPFVAQGDEVSSSTYWHGKLSDAWATAWMDYFTAGQGKFVTTAMEDTGILQSLRYLANAGRVDWQRILVLRTVSNFDQQPRGMTAAESLARQRVGTYSAYLPSIEAAYRVGHVVVKELLSQWSRYAKSAPAH